MPARFALLVPGFRSPAIPVVALCCVGLVGAVAPVEQAPAPRAAPGAPRERADDELANRAVAIFREACGECHGADVEQPRGALRLTDSATLVDYGLLVPGAPDESLLIRAVRRVEPGLEMPPDDPLPAADVDTLVAWVAAGAPWPAVAPRTPGEALFESEVLPVLRSRCFGCHGPEAPKPQGGLRLSGRTHLVAGGSRGPAVVPGQPDASLLIAAVRGTHPELAMPPSGALEEHQLRALERWVEQGAPWPEDLTIAADDAGVHPVPRAFTPPVAVAPPTDTSAGPDAHPVDAFLARALDAAGLEAAPRADPRALLRRLHFDLTGLPPTFAELERFAADPSDAAFGAAVDELLARPAYGERMARRWLDVVRYAESNGFERDDSKPQAWRYRDWVAAAFADDLPYDDFLVAQLAGDEQPDSAPDALVATGFWRLGQWDDEPNDRREAEFDELDDILRTVTEGLLGVTVGCARCHDHRFDPIAQADYYSLLAWFRNVSPYEAPRYALDSAVLSPVDADAADLERWRIGRERELERLRAELDGLVEPPLRAALATDLQSRGLAEAERVRAEFERLLTLPFDERRTALQTAGLPSTDAAIAVLPFAERQRAITLLGILEDEGQLAYEGDLTWALVVSERGGEPVPTHVLRRGLASSPLDAVAPATPPAIALGPPPTPPDEGTSSGRRSALAAWIASPANPLTARVWVNRVWQQHFGVGLVPTANDFGNTGDRASHPELLDWLALWFVDSGWSTKGLHRLIVTSEAYRRASRWRAPSAERHDPDNRLLWRQRPRRLEAEMVRDAMLAVTGELDATVGGPPVHPRLPREVLAGQSRPGAGWAPPEPDADHRRSLYVAVQRGLLDPLAQLFDRPPPTLPSGGRPVTTTSPQALHLLNGSFTGARAQALARRLVAEAGEDREAQVTRAFESVLGRAPDLEERRLVGAHLDLIEADAARARRVLRFEPRVPERVDYRFLDLASGDDLLAVPGGPWRAEAGEFGDVYNGTLTPEPLRGPRAVLAAPPARDFAFAGRVVFDDDCRAATFYVRARERGGVFEAVALHLDREEERLVLLELGVEPRILGVGGLPPAPDGRFAIDLRAVGGRVAVDVAGGSGAGEGTPPDGTEAVAESRSAVAATLDEGAGVFAVAAVGGAVALEDASVTLDGDDRALAPPAPEPALTALESLCLVLLNSNEFHWLD